MSNSRVITTGFKYFAPATLAEALGLLQQYKGRPLAGGTDLMNEIKTSRLTPEALVYTMTIEGLDSIAFDKELTIGAAAKLSDIEAARSVQEKYPALKEAVNAIGGTQIRNMGTLVGNLCNASPGADIPPILIALGATVVINRAAEDGSITARELTLEDFFTGPKQTVLEPGELLTTVKVPEPPPDSGQSFRRLARVRLDIAKINCGVYLLRKGNSIGEVRITFGSVAPTPVRAGRTEGVLQGQPYSEQLIRQAAAVITEDIKPIDDIRSSAEYRNHTAAVLLKDALAEAWKRAGGK